MKVKLLMVAELDVAGEEPLLEAQAQLDAFRESVQASAEHGISLYRATCGDLEEFAENDALLPRPGIVAK